MPANTCKGLVKCSCQSEEYCCYFFTAVDESFVSLIRRDDLPKTDYTPVIVFFFLCVTVYCTYVSHDAVWIIFISYWAEGFFFSSPDVLLFVLEEVMTQGKISRSNTEMRRSPLKTFYLVGLFLDFTPSWSCSAFEWQLQVSHSFSYKVHLIVNDKKP